MANFSKCSSCGVQPNILKIITKGNGDLQFRHLTNCKIGRATYNKKCECTLTYRYYCNKCGTQFTMSNEHFVGGYTDGGGTASQDCPICWAIAEVK